MARIARELHDVVTHAVSGIVVRAATEPRLAVNAPGGTRVLKDVETAGREALAELRRLLGVLRADHIALPTAPLPGEGRARVWSGRSGGSV